ncbi:MAG: hypothetical protein OEX77_09655 [Candidatus Bathyarchaeota archaeon]|nr:hypothetical protein [Candidatus Bathyarchaeota archaeon]MDH5733702.1 hypothetical protein [Candidatus Bathyarchaeota archaeon]
MTSGKALQDPHGFDPEIRQIEQEIVEFFAETDPEFSGRHPIIVTVMAYFYIRRNLTQRDLQNLTGFSAGTISKSVRQLVDINMVTKEVIPGTHEHIYKMEELPFMSARIFLRTIKLLEELEEELKKTKDTLDTHAEEMQNLNGYQRIYTITTQLLRIIPPSQMIVTLIEKELKFTKTSQ